MLILLPAQCHWVLFQESVLGTATHRALEQSKAIGDTIVRVDQLAVICDQATAEELLRTATVHCPEAVPIIVEAIESGSR